MSAVTELQAPSLEATLLSLLPPKNDALREGPDAGKEVLLVDVGGGRGDALSSVRKQRSDLKGRIIVQDLPKEIEGREPVDGIEAMAYDFFTPQPVRGILCLPILKGLPVRKFELYADPPAQEHACTSSPTSSTIGPTPPAAKSCITFSPPLFQANQRS